MIHSPDYHRARQEPTAPRPPQRGGGNHPKCHHSDPLNGVLSYTISTKRVLNGTRVSRERRRGPSVIPWLSHHRLKADLRSSNLQCNKGYIPGMIERTTPDAIII